MPHFLFKTFYLMLLDLLVKKYSQNIFRQRENNTFVLIQTEGLSDFLLVFYTFHNFNLK